MVSGMVRTSFTVVYLFGPIVCCLCMVPFVLCVFLKGWIWHPDVDGLIIGMCTAVATFLSATRSLLGMVPVNTQRCVSINVWIRVLHVDGQIILAYGLLRLS